LFAKVIVRSNSFHEAYYCFEDLPVRQAQSAIEEAMFSIRLTHLTSTAARPSNWPSEQPYVCALGGFSLDMKRPEQGQRLRKA
jgi:hypothetical protein